MYITKYKSYFPLLLLITIFLLISSASAQISQGGRPYSYTHPDLIENINTLTMPSVNIDSLLVLDSIENEIEIETGKMLLPRIAAKVSVNIDFLKGGTWETISNGGNLCRLHIVSNGATSIAINYDEFWLDEGATFFVYNPQDTHQVRGAFTNMCNRKSGKFATAILKGDEVVLEYYEPPNTKNRSTIHIKSIAHGYYGNARGGGPCFGHGCAAPCAIDVNCPVGDNWKEQSKSVGLIALEDQTRQGSGGLLNNVRFDQTPYFLTAKHVIEDYVDVLDELIFYFRYEHAVCNDTADGPLDYTVYGSELKALNSGTDVALLRLYPSPGYIPFSYGVAYAGWSSVDIPAVSAVSISHPRCDVKKIAFSTGPAENYDFFGTPVWLVHYNPSVGDGIIEKGSSGSPLFDQNKRVVGITSMTFGASCSTTDEEVFYGKFSLAWEYSTDSSEQLKYWLDPDNTGATVLDGLDPNGPCCISPIRGNIDYDSNDIVDSNDVDYMVDWMFNFGPPPQCRQEANVNGDIYETIDMYDLVQLVDYVYSSGPPPANCP